MGITVVDGLEPSYNLIDKYVFGLRPGLGDGGGYNSVLKEGFVSICFRDLNYPKDYIIRHEFFHALQYGYPESCLLELGEKPVI